MHKFIAQYRETHDGPLLRLHGYIRATTSLHAIQQAARALMDLGQTAVEVVVTLEE